MCRDHELKQLSCQQVMERARTPQRSTIWKLPIKAVFGLLAPSIPNVGEPQATPSPREAQRNLTNPQSCGLPLWSNVSCAERLSSKCSHAGLFLQAADTRSQSPDSKTDMPEPQALKSKLRSLSPASNYPVSTTPETPRQCMLLRVSWSSPRYFEEIIVRNGRSMCGLYLGHWSTLF